MLDQARERRRLNKSPKLQVFSILEPHLFHFLPQFLLFLGF